MSKNAIAKIVKSVVNATKKHSPEILTGLGIAGMVTTTVLAVKATPKAMELIKEKKKAERLDELTPVETVKATWKCYIPSAAVGATSIACLIGASSVNLRRNAALAAAYSLSETTLSTYQKKVLENIGEKKEREVRDAIAKDTLAQNPIGNTEIIVTEKGNTRIFDITSGRRFRSDIDTLKRAVNELNRRMRDEMYIDLNEFYAEIGLEPVAIGYDIGWNIDKAYIDLDLSSQIDEDGVPCIVMGFDVAPSYNFR